jgi:hypothetical protein
MTSSTLRAVWIAACIFAIGLFASAYTLGQSWVRGRAGDEQIRVVGSARKSIRSDFIIWNAGVTQNAATAATAYAPLKANVEKVRAYLLQKGVAANEVTLDAINIKTLYENVKGQPQYSAYEEGDSNSGIYRKVVAYQLSQNIEVRSSNVDLVDKVSRGSTELISRGIPFVSAPPMYLYTKLSDLKVEMQAAAAQDARDRAQAIARAAGCRLGEVRYARMSAPSITPLYSSQESDGGVDDTSALEKKITAIVNVGYAVR